jgi:hypothetical protein
MGRFHDPERIKKMNLPRLGKLINRAWYYFRMGYGTYLTFLLGYISTLVTVYYLAIKNAPALLEVFPHFQPFAILATVIGAPLAVAIGWLHLKRSSLYSSEVDIGVEANPYYYKLPPGFTPVAWRVTLVTLRILRRLAETSGTLTDSEAAEIKDLESKTLTLLAGGYVGAPRRKTNF